MEGMRVKMKSNVTQYIGKEVNVIVDKPIGSHHPKYPDIIYLVNYGYVPNTISGDGEELDCYILGEYKPLKEYKGKCIAVIHRKNEEDDKLIIHTNTKEESIEIFIKEMKIDRDCVYTVGDELDDLEMLKKYNGYRMDKCNEILKEYITKSVSNISELIDIIG